MSKSASSIELLAILLAGVGVAPLVQGQTNYLQNHSFEVRIRDNGWRGLWDIDSDIADRGEQSRTRRFIADGRFGFKLLPNERNTVEASRLGYGIYQLLPAAELRGKAITFSGALNGVGGATAVLRVAAVAQDGNSYTRFLQAKTDLGPDDEPPAMRQRDVFEVPDVPIDWLFIACSAEGTSGAAYFDDISVTIEPPEFFAQGQPDPGPALSAVATVNYHKVLRTIPRSIYGINILYPAGGYGLWSSVHGLPNPEAAALARELGPTQLRFPGGGFANFYHWRNGVGPVSSRPLTEIAPDRGVTGNEFGTDEALVLAGQLGAPLFVTVNSDTGSAQEAADWVRHVNGRERKVEFWEIGNELYFSPDPSDPTSGPTWQPTNYVKQYLEFAREMRAADPGIKLGADMEFNLGIQGCGVIDESGCWAEVLLREAAHQIDFLALHSGLAPIMVGYDPGWDLRTVYASMLAAPIQVKSLMDDLAEKVDELAPEHTKRIRFAMTEWGPLFQSDPRSRFIDHSQTLGSALFVASMMKTLIEHPRVDIAHGFNLMDNWTSGWVGRRQGRLVKQAPFHAFELYSRQFGSELLETQTRSPTYDTRSIALVSAIQNVPFLDVVSSKNPEGGLRIVGVNKHFDRPIKAYFQVEGFAANGGEAWTLTGTGIDANRGTEIVGVPEGFFAEQAKDGWNGRFDQGSPEEITFTSAPVTISGSCFELEFPARSATALVISGYELQPGTTEGCGGDTQGQSPPDYCAWEPFSPECSQFHQ